MIQYFKYLSSLSFQSLAKYLLYLDANPAEYAKYHLWRSDYGVYQEFQGPLYPLCLLCSLLHDEEKFQKNSLHVEPHARDKECDFKKWDFSNVKSINLSDN